MTEQRYKTDSIDLVAQLDLGKANNSSRRGLIDEREGCSCGCGSKGRRQVDLRWEARVRELGEESCGMGEERFD